MLPVRVKITPTTCMNLKMRTSKVDPLQGFETQITILSTADASAKKGSGTFFPSVEDLIRRLDGRRQERTRTELAGSTDRFRIVITVSCVAIREKNEIQRVTSKPLEHFAARNAAKKAGGFDTS